MRIKLPAYVEVTPDAFRHVTECNYAEFREARKHETDYSRRKELDRFLRIIGTKWKLFPLMTVEELTGSTE